MCLDPLTAVVVGGSAGACLAWNGKRLLRHGAHDSIGWPEASAAEIEEILHFCQLVQGAYVHSVEDMRGRVPFIHPDGVLEFADHAMGQSEEAMCPPHFIYMDAVRQEICICIRGMRLYSPTDYWTLLSNRRGEKQFADGFVHRGIFDAAQWLCARTAGLLKELFERHCGYALVLVGHSLGAGVAAMLAILLAERSEELLGISRASVKCFAFAPPRIMSLNLAVGFSDVIRGIVLQDDFWPRTSTSMVAKIFISSACMLQFVLISRMLRDVLISDKRRLADTKRLYPPGVLYHIVCREASWCAPEHPYRVLTANPNGPRFEKVVLSLRATADHRIRTYEAALRHALEATTESSPSGSPSPATGSSQSDSFFSASSISELDEDWESIRECHSPNTRWQDHLISVVADAAPSSEGSSATEDGSHDGGLRADGLEGGRLESRRAQRRRWLSGRRWSCWGDAPTITTGDRGS